MFAYVIMPAALLLGRMSAGELLHRAVQGGDDLTAVQVLLGGAPFLVLGKRKAQSTKIGCAFGANRC